MKTDISDRKPELIKLNNSIRFGRGNISWGSKLGGYYQDFRPAISNLISQQFGQFDSQGLPMLGFGKNAVYNPVYLAQYGLMLHDDMIDHKNDHTFLLKRILDWFHNNKEIFKDTYIWPSPIENKKYNLKKGWVSGMYQGQVISLFLRAYQLIGDEKYLAIPDAAINLFKYDTQEGGVIRIDEKGYLWIEEYPSQTGSYVLNGFIYAVLGLIDYFRITRSAEVKELIDHSLYTLKSNVKNYDLGYWSKYDLLKEELVSDYYQINIHVGLMSVLYELTKEEVFSYYSNKWESNYNNNFSRKVLVPIMKRVQPRLKKWI
ncbi:MAG: D-glucuronyl C5-epimerase family protein [Bacteroidota bacterium]